MKTISTHDPQHIAHDMSWILQDLPQHAAMVVNIHGNNQHRCKLHIKPQGALICIKQTEFRHVNGHAVALTHDQYIITPHDFQNISQAWLQHLLPVRAFTPAAVMADIRHDAGRSWQVNPDEAVQRLAMPLWKRMIAQHVQLDCLAWSAPWHGMQHMHNLDLAVIHQAVQELLQETSTQEILDVA